MATAISCIKKNRGRPKQFDREDALEKAMLLFWQHGYEATSLSHLVEATGAKAPTLYAEFSNKEGLFQAVLEHYIERFTRKNDARLFDENSSLETALYHYLHAIAECYTDKETPLGCFIICTSSVLATSSQTIAASIRRCRTLQENTLLRFLNQRQKSGELPQTCNTAHLAQFLCCMIRGMSVQAQDGASYEQLCDLMDTLLRLLPELKMIPNTGETCSSVSPSAPA